ncbi:hypothetical protein [Streptomyces purpurogeneiscleroticus]|uniref:hypothetical protein n=1 Tax=Streptomyces purpurogeneiscleroticus TaxID=68259 RepID=UPI001CBDDEC0|nr:hypothetical protein [Streptomyces purpurogeneiscleroticus]
MLALPAAVRLPRTVVVRRALLSGLFLIGFVVLAVAFGGGTAHAADAGTATDTGFETATASSPSGMPGTTTSTSSTSTSPAESATSDPDANSATTDGDSPFDGSDAALEREAAEREARAAQQAGARLSGGAQETGERLGKAVQPLTDRLRPVTDPVTAPVDQVVQDVQHATGLPIHLSGVSAEQGRDGERPRHGDARNGGREHAAVADRCGTDRIADDRPTAPVDTTGGPDRTAARVAADGAGDAPGRGGLPGHLPQGPVAPAPHLTGDGNGPRGGDQHAVLPGTDPRFGLVPGGVRAASGAPTRERSTDILEFPG